MRPQSPKWWELPKRSQLRIVHRRTERSQSMPILVPRRVRAGPSRRGVLLEREHLSLRVFGTSTPLRSAIASPIPKLRTDRSFRRPVRAESRRDPQSQIPFLAAIGSNYRGKGETPRYYRLATRDDPCRTLDAGVGRSRQNRRWQVHRA